MKSLILAAFLAVSGPQVEPPDQLTGMFVIIWECHGHIHSAALLDAQHNEYFRGIHPQVSVPEIIAALKDLAAQIDPTAPVNVMMVQVGGVCTGTGA